MKTVQRMKTIYHDKRLGFYAPLFMGTVNLVATLVSFSWLTLNYCLYSYILVLVKVFLEWLNQRTGRKELCFAGALSLAVLLIPMTVAMVKTIREKAPPSYPFFWLIYLYATYGTVKFVLAIRARRQARKSGDACKGVTSWISLVTAAYTIQMMEFALIATFDTEHSSDMILMQYLTHGAILLFTLFVIVLLLVSGIRIAQREDEAE